MYKNIADTEDHDCNICLLLHVRAEVVMRVYNGLFENANRP
jgi:hypothetical protein